VILVLFFVLASGVCGLVLKIGWGVDIRTMGFDTNLVTTIIGFGLSASFIVFVCSRIICGRLQERVGVPSLYEIEPRTDIERVISLFFL